MLVQRRRRWVNIVPTLAVRVCRDPLFIQGYHGLRTLAQLTLSLRSPDQKLCRMVYFLGATCIYAHWKRYINYSIYISSTTHNLPVEPSSEAQQYHFISHFIMVQKIIQRTFTFTAGDCGVRRVTSFYHAYIVCLPLNYLFFWHVFHCETRSR